MIEPGFGSSPSIWTGIPSPAFGWIQPGNALGMQAQTAVPADASPPNMYGPGSLGMHWGIPTLFAPEVALPALLATVAAKRGQPQGPTNDHEVEEFIYDVCELLPGLAEVDVRCEGGKAVLSGNVLNKRFKRDVGEIAWAIPGINDVQNNVTIIARRRSRGAGKESEPQSSASTRKNG